MISSSSMRAVALLVMSSMPLSLPGASASTGAAADVGARPSLRLGWADVGDRSETVVAALDEAAASPAPVRAVARVVARWREVEHGPGDYRWAQIEERIDRLAGAGASVSLCLDGGHPDYTEDGDLPGPWAPGSIDAFTAWVRDAVRTFAGRVDVVEIQDRVDERYDPAVYAFVLKSASVAARAEARALGVEVAVAQGAIGLASLDWQRRLWREDIAPYVDVLPWVDDRPRAEVDVSTDDPLVEPLRAALEYPPAPSMWLRIPPTASADDPMDRNLARAASVLGSSAEVVLIGEDARTDPSRLDAWLLGMQALIDEGFGPAPPAELTFTSAEGAPIGEARALARLFSETSFETAIVYFAPGTGEERRIDVRIPSSFVRDTRVVDPVAGSEVRAPVSSVPGDARARAVRVPRGAWPLVLRFRSSVPVPEGLAAEREDVEVERERGLTAEEIIARFQAVQKRQDDALERWTARARVDFHFKLAQGGSTIDVSIESNYFWERGRDLEWEQTDYYVNGNKVRWKKIPELPLIEPEKVVTLPLDLSLDKTYAYRLLGTDRVDGREAYVLAFEPVASKVDLSLYRGRVWIDRETFVRVRANIVQTNLESPVISNEETDIFRPFEGPDGGEYWMLSEIDGQQIWTAAGRSFVVQREVYFDSFEINPPRETFAAMREEAYRSQNQMLRDTDEGFRYLERRDDGSRVVKTDVDSGQLLLGGGLFGDSSTGGVVPLAGVNYFDYDLFDANVQTNVFFAGAFLFGTVSYPNLFDRNVDVSVDVLGNALKLEDRLYLDEDEVLEERIRTRTQRLSVRLGVPIGSFTKVNLVGAQNWVSYFDAEDGEAALDRLSTASGTAFDFALPEDHTESNLSVELEFNRRGYNLLASYALARRSDWRPWGLTSDGVLGALAQRGSAASFTPGAIEYDPSQQSFSYWSASVFKEWFLPRFQKLRAEVNLLGGDDLDRFSGYEFSFFGDTRLSGFSGTGVRFDRGGVARFGYAFNLFEAIRFDAVVEAARVENRLLDIDPEWHGGVGVSGNFIGPWKTVINLNYGYAVESAIPELEGEQEFLLLILKLF